MSSPVTQDLPSLWCTPRLREEGECGREGMWEGGRERKSERERQGKRKDRKKGRGGVNKLSTWVYIHWGVNKLSTYSGGLTSISLSSLSRFASSSLSSLGEMSDTGLEDIRPRNTLLPPPVMVPVGGGERSGMK